MSDELFWREFDIPLDPSELVDEPFSTNSSRRFVVQDYDSEQLLDEKNFSKRLSTVLSNIQKKPSAILENENFDLIFTFLKNVGFLLKNHDNKVGVLSNLDLLFKQLVGCTQAVCNEAMQTLEVGLEKRSQTSQSLDPNATDDLNDSGSGTPQKRRPEFGLISARDRYELRNQLKMYVYLDSWFLALTKNTSLSKLSIATTPAAKRKGKKKAAEEQGRSSWEEESMKEKLLGPLVSILDIELVHLWKGRPEDKWVQLFLRVATTLLENSANARSKLIRRCLGNLFSSLSKSYQMNQNVSVALLNLLHNHEFLPGPIAQIIAQLFQDDQNTADHILTALLREISKIEETAKETPSIKNLALFLSEIGEKCPQQVVHHMALVFPHIDSPSYLLRNAVVQVAGSLILSGATVEEENSSSSRDSLFEILEERVYDLNAFTRSKVIQTWSHLIQSRAVPLLRLHSVLPAIIGRLKDKASNVRKPAIQFISAALEYNPFGPKLGLTTFQKQQQQLQEAIEKHGKANLANEDTGGSTEAEPNEKGLPTKGSKQESPLKAKPELAAEDLSVLIKKHKFCEEAVVFITGIHETISILCQLLRSKTISDTLESIQFLVTAKTFAIECCNDALRDIMELVWSTEAPIQEAILNAFTKIFLTAAAPNKLIKLATRCNIGQLASMEEIIMRLGPSSLPPKLSQALWEIFFARAKADSPQVLLEARGALMVLSMISNFEFSQLKKNSKKLVGMYASEKIWKADPLIVRFACIIFQRLSKQNDFLRMKESSGLMESLGSLIKNREIGFAQWFIICEEAVRTIYLLAEHPDSILEGIIRTMAAHAFPLSKADEPSAVAPPPTGAEAAVFGPTTRVADLSKFCFMLGHVAIQQLIHIETIQQVLRKKQMSDKTQTSSKKKTDKTKTAIEQELGQDIENAVVETEIESLQKKAEKEIIGSRGLIGSYAHNIARICANGSTFGDPSLRNSAILALCKFMAISQDFCEKHLKLLFTLLQTAPEPSVRSNIVIALGDLACRFPNSIEPWLARVFSQLRDKEPIVRKNTLQVLSRLIQNDMIQGKGHLFELALSVEDPDEAIAKLARVFFTNLSRKANAIYNALPDIISNLSLPENKVSEESFKSIVKLLFSYIDKDKQTESLTEKLCQRFAQTQDIQVWRNNAFCLSLLNMNEKAIRKLIELAKLWESKLEDEQVVNYFVDIITKARKSTKPEIRKAIGDLETKINKVIQLEAYNEENPLQGDADTVDQTPKAPRSAVKGQTVSSLIRSRSAKKKKTSAKTASTKKKQKSRKVEASDSEDDLSLSSEDEDSESEAESSDEEGDVIAKRRAKTAPKKSVAQAIRRNNTRPTRTAATRGLKTPNAVYQDTSDEDNEPASSDEEEAHSPASSESETKSRTTRQAPTRKQKPTQTPHKPAPKKTQAKTRKKEIASESDSNDTSDDDIIAPKSRARTAALPTSPDSESESSSFEEPSPVPKKKTPSRRGGRKPKGK